MADSDFRLQLLHFSDGEAGLLAASTAPNLAALVDKFEDEYANSITLAGGDDFLPGPFLAAGTDAALIDELNAVTGATLAANATVPIAAVDIAIHNAIGVEASAIGNHEFDLGSRVLKDAIVGASGAQGAQFPFISANLDFSGDADLRSIAIDTAASAGLEEAASLKGKIVPSAILVENGEKIGIVGATTQILEAISSPSGTEVEGFPTGAGANGEVDDMDLLAAQLQPVIDDLIAQGVNKVILMAHLQVIANEMALAGKLSGVDIILAAGSNTRLGDADDTAVDFPGHSASFADTYPLVIEDKDGRQTLIVNTDNEYTYLGRLVVDFDADGHLVAQSLTDNAGVNGAYAATDDNVAAAWGVPVDQLAASAFAEGTRGDSVQTLTEAVQSVISVKDGNVYGYSDVYLEGERATVRSEETNLGNLSADANAHAATLALGSAAAETFVVSLKNGGGIRAQIGTISAPDPVDGTVDKLPPPEGSVSQLDIENSLRFNNQLMVFETTAAGLKAILEHGVAAGTLQGRFPQIGGIAFSWDPDQPAGSRVGDIALVGDGYRVNLVDDGVLQAGTPATISVVTLNFLANGGDGYPIKANGSNFRYLVEQPDGDYALTEAVDEAKDFTSTSVIDAYLAAGSVASTGDASGAFAAGAATYLVGTEARADFAEIVTAGETATNGYVFDGIPDGIGVLDNGDGTLRILVNHEFGASAGAVRAHGSTGAYVSDLVVDKATLQVVSGQDFLQSADQLYLAAADGGSWSNGATTAFNRFCSGDLAAASAFLTDGAGYEGRIYLTGEEAGAEGRAFAHVLSGDEAGRVYELPALGNLSFENVVANATEQAKTVVAALDDTSTNGQVYFYVGAKQATGNAVEKAGLAGGTLFGVKVGNSTGAATEVGSLANPTETGLGIDGGVGTFSLVSLGDVKGLSGAALNTASIDAGATNFLRPEDGAWSSDGKTFYFVTTASASGASRLWALDFADAANPEAGGSIRMLLDGSEGQVMMDNLTVAEDGSLLIQEDPGNNDRLAKILKYSPITDTLVEVAQHDPALFTGSGKLTADEESSGIVDVSSMFAGVAGYDTAKYSYFLVADQVHKPLAEPASAVEMGQLALMATAKNALLGEQAALANYLQDFHATPETAYAAADTPAAEDGRIQNLNVRAEAVLGETPASLLNASVDGLGDVITLYFDRALDAANGPGASQFAVDNGGARSVESVQVVGNKVILSLDAALTATAAVSVSYSDPGLKSDDLLALQNAGGVDVASFADAPVGNWLQLAPGLGESFAQAGTIKLAGAEISAYDPASQRLFVTSFSGLQVVAIDEQLQMSLLATLQLGSNDINSVAVKNGLVAVAVAAADKTQPGSVYFLDADAAVGDPAMILGSVLVGALPDMLSFTPDGLKLLVANEGEQDTAGNNPEGSVSIIDLAAGVANATVKTASFAAFNDQLAALKAEGVRLFAGENGFATITVAQDLEPEYIAIAPDGQSALVTLQENNAIGVLDLSSGEFTDIVPLGLKSYLGLPFDGSDRDGAGNSKLIEFNTDVPVYGQYMPDSIAAFAGTDGKVYYVIANEGDDRNDFIDPDETASLSTRDLDDASFPDEAALKANTGIGRLTTSKAPGNDGDADGDGDVDRILSYGGRSFSILDENGVMVFDSGSQTEQFIAQAGLYTNAQGAGLYDDGRSDNKGTEPEGVTIGQLGGKTLAFVGLERGGGGVMVYDVTNPLAVEFVQYLRTLGDESPEGLAFISAADSPSGGELLVVSNELSTTVSLYENASFNNPADNQTLTGDDSANTLSGGRGDDLVDGRAGTDTASFRGARDGYELSLGEAGRLIDDTVGTDGSDTLVAIERLAFADGKLAFDLDADPGQAYRALKAAYGRAPTEGELGQAIAALEGGTSLASLVAGLTDDSAFLAVYGGTSDVGYVDKLYEQVLGRTADAGGQAYWVGRLAGGASRSELLGSFAESTENQLVTAAYDLDGDFGQLIRLYESTFDRAPDVGGIDYWQGRMAAGLSLAEVAAGFVASGEFASHYGSVTSDADFVGLVLHHAYEREAASGEVEAWIGQGLSRPQLLAEVAESLETKLGLVGIAQDGVFYL